MNVSPADYNSSETLSTLRFASRAARITNHVEAVAFKSIGALKELLNELQEEHKKLRGTFVFVSPAPVLFVLGAFMRSCVYALSICSTGT